jgi:predicted transcriptional regulator
MDTYKSLQILCAQAGTNLSEACRRAGVNRNTVDHWQRREPKQFKTLRKLVQNIQEIKKAHDEIEAVSGESR